MLAMCAIFWMCGNQREPDLQLVEKLATPLTTTVYKVNNMYQGIKDTN